MLKKKKKSTAETTAPTQTWATGRLCTPPSSRWWAGKPAPLQCVSLNGADPRALNVGHRRLLLVPRATFTEQKQ